MNAPLFLSIYNDNSSVYPLMYPDMNASIFPCSPGRIDPDNIQVAEEVALWIQQVAAGATLGPLSVRWGAVSSLYFQLLQPWKTQTYRRRQRAKPAVSRPACILHLYNTNQSFASRSVVKTICKHENAQDSSQQISCHCKTHLSWYDWL